MAAKSNLQDNYLSEGLTTLKSEFINNRDVIRLVARSNRDNAHISQANVVQMEREWQQTEGVSLFVVSLTTNDLSDRLKKVQKKNLAVKEILITDRRGLVIAATNKTSNFYYGNETWWQNIAEAKKIKGYFGEKTYDKKDGEYNIPLYLTILDSQKHTVIGVLRALYSQNKLNRVLTYENHLS